MTTELRVPFLKVDERWKATASLRIPSVVSGRFSQPFLKSGTVEAPQCPNSFSRDLPCRSLLPQSFWAALQESRSFDEREHVG